MSPHISRNSASFMPTLPIDVRFRSWPLDEWEVTQDGNDYLFNNRDNPRLQHIASYKVFLGTEYLRELLSLSMPEALVSFMNTYTCPIEGIVEDPVDGELHRVTVPFRWSEFIKIQSELKDALVLPLAKLRRNPKMKHLFNLTKFTVQVEERDGVYYGTVTIPATVEGCYRVIAFQRLLADIRYGICEYCGNPFEITSNRERKYCPYPAPCAHAVAQQKYRSRKKAQGKEKRSKKNTRRSRPV